MPEPTTLTELNATIQGSVGQHEIFKSKSTTSSSFWGTTSIHRPTPPEKEKEKNQSCSHCSLL